MTKNNENEELEDELLEEEDDQTGGSGDGGADGADNSNTNKGGNKSGSASGAGKTFTQEQVNRMATREKNQGRAAALRELGIDPKDARTVAMVKAFLESQKTDDQRAAEQQAADQSARADAERRATIAEAKAEAMMLGVKPQHVDDLVTLALAKMTEDSDLKTIIGEFKTKYPVWFGASDDDDDKGSKNKGKTGQKGTGSSVKESGKNKPGSAEQGLGARLAAQRKSGSKKTSYWNK